MKLTSLYHTIAVAGVLSYFVPMLLLSVRKLWHDAFFTSFTVYWGIGGIINMTDLLPGFREETLNTIGIVYNMLDIPFLLLIFMYTTTSMLIKRFTTVAIVVFCIIQITGAIMKGIDYDALKYPMGVGIALVLTIVIWEIIRYTQKIEHSNRQNAKIFIYAALLFEYASFILIYIFDYYVEIASREDTFLIYYLSTIVAMLIASCGYLMFRKYERKSSLAY